MTENEKNLQDLEEWYKMNPSEGAAYAFQKKLLEEEMAREAEQAQAATGGTAPPPDQQTAAPVAPAPQQTIVPSVNISSGSSVFMEERFKEAEALFQNKKDETKMVDLFTSLAGEGHAKAIWRLGTLYKQGRGLPKDRAKGFELQRKAAELGDADAQSTIGGYYLHEVGDRATADEWFSKAFEGYRKTAEQGDASAQYGLGCCYCNGYGVAQDYAKASEWYSKAAGQGNKKAQMDLDDLKQRGLI